MELSRIQTQRNSTWNAPYTFSGKEKDVETGYGYFVARYYDSDLSIWLSVDPMSDKYPSMSPYNYCANNPVILVDPDGRDTSFSSAAIRAIFVKLFEDNHARIMQLEKIINDPNSKPKQVRYAQNDLIMERKIKSDFEEICSKLTPLRIYYSTITDEENKYGSCQIFYFKNYLLEILRYEYEINFNPNYIDALLHENRHSCQPQDWTIFQKEHDAWSFTKFQSPAFFSIAFEKTYKAGRYYTQCKASGKSDIFFYTFDDFIHDIIFLESIK